MINYYRISVLNINTKEEHTAYIRDVSLRHVAKRAVAFMLKCANTTKINPIDTTDGIEAVRNGWTFFAETITQEEYEAQK